MDVNRNEYTDWDHSAMDGLSMRDSLMAGLSDAMVVAPLIHVVHVHAGRSNSDLQPATYFYHYGQVHEDPEYHVSALINYSTHFMLSTN